MCKMIAVTNRKICERDFLEQIRRVTAAKPDMIILREKDLREKEYLTLAKEVVNICNEYKVTVTLHNFISVAEELKCDRIHLPLSILRENADKLESFQIIGTSVHTVSEAVEAECLGANYIIAGHIFATSCKPGLAPRGIEFLEQVISNVTIPVYAIGGIHPDNVSNIINTGISGYCMMSEFMKV